MPAAAAWSWKCGARRRNFFEILHDIQQRDYQDANREVAPLRQAEDAVQLDTTHLDLKGSLEALINLVRERIAL